jgi:hypothetical protein
MAIYASVELDERQVATDDARPGEASGSPAHLPHAIAVAGEVFVPIQTDALVVSHRAAVAAAPGSEHH